MNAWRICAPQFAGSNAVLSGEGAKEEGGRWNHVGLPLVYASENSSLAILETLVRTSLELFPELLVAVRIEIPDDAPVRTIRLSDLPAGWDGAAHSECAAIGSRWIRRRAELVLRVPSVVNRLEMNIMLNPAHPGVKRCRVKEPIPVRLDQRLPALTSSAEERGSKR